MTPLEYINLLLQRLPDIVADEVEKAHTSLAVYVSDHMHTKPSPNYNPNKQKGNKAHYAERGAGKPYIRNSTNMLYANTNTLLQAATVKGKKGYATEVERNGSDVTLKAAINLSEVPYARIHELGGEGMPARPYLRPALEDFKAHEMDNLQRAVVRRLGAIA